MGTDMLTHKERVEYISQIVQRMDVADYAASKFVDSCGIWTHYYDDGAQKSVLVRDLKFLLAEVQRLGAEKYRLAEKLEDAKYKLESLGSSLEESDD
jgi:N-acetyl-gamma-glutamylphosphate reductase